MNCIIKKSIYNKHYQTIFLLFFIAVIHITRSPNVSIQGRFWAEEGNIFFYNAWINSPLKALFTSYGGYLNLSTNATTLIARWCFPLEYAPYFTMTVGLLFQLLPSFLLLTAKDAWLSSFKTRALAILLLLFVPESLEISLQSLHIQFNLSLSCALILILDNQATYQRWLKLCIILLTTLSGALSVILVPLYLYRSLTTKNHLRIEQFIILLIGNIIQFSLFFQPFKERSYHPVITDFFSVFFARDLYVPFLGNNNLSNPYLFYIQSLVKNHQTPILACTISILFLLLILFCLYKYPKVRITGYLLLCIFFNLILSILGAIGPDYWFFQPYFNQRYVFISQSLLCLLLVYLLYALPKKGQYICYFLSVWLLISGIHNFYYFTSHSYGVTPWREQVKLWKTNPKIELQLWPESWHMTLPPHNN